MRRSATPWQHGRTISSSKCCPRPLPRTRSQPVRSVIAQRPHASDALARRYAAAGYCAGHRVALLLENRPDFLLHWLALNGLGASIVPINPDLRANELEYLLGHSEAVLVVAIASRQPELRRASAAAGRAAPVIGPDDTPPVAPPSPGGDGQECALLYTSGTTGLPKGCILSQEYFLMAGGWYVGMGGLCTLQSGRDRMLTPLPLFHVNALAYSVIAMMLTGGCLIVLDRFHPRSWWDSVMRARATIVHCLGVMPAMLMSLAPSEAERGHQVRFAFCPGPDRRLHAEAEARFGIPLIDAWAMTETGGGAVVSAHRRTASHRRKLFRPHGRFHAGANRRQRWSRRGTGHAGRIAGARTPARTPGADSSATI